MMFKPLYDIVDYLKIFEKYLGMRIYIVFILGIIASVFEGIGILMLLPLLESLDSSGVQQESHFINDILSRILSFIGLSESITSILLLISCAFILKGLMTFFALGYKANLLGQLFSHK